MLTCKHSPICYINGLKVSLEEYIAYKQWQKELRQLMAAKLFDQPARRSFDYTEWPIIRIDGKGDWDAVPMEWGIISSAMITRQQADKFKSEYGTYNARGEDLLQKPLYKKAARKFRCLVPSTGFYEHRHLPMTGKKGQLLKQTEKIPYRIYVPEAPLFFMAGICLPWFNQEEDRWTITFAICTTEAGELMSKIHNSKKRQPTILTPELAERWTEKDLGDKEIIDIATHQFDNSRLRAHRVSKDFLSSKDPAAGVSLEELSATNEMELL